MTETPIVLGEQARRQFERGNYPDAIARLGMALRLAPGDPDLLSALIISLCAAGRYDEVAPAWSRYVRAGGQEHRIRLFHAVALRERGRLGESLDQINQIACDPALALDDGIDAMWSLIPLAEDERHATGAVRLGLSLATSLARRYPDAPDPRFAIGFFTAAGRTDPIYALPHVAEAVGMAPEREDFILYLGNLFFELHQEERALSCWNRVALERIRCEVTLTRMARVLRRRGERTLAGRCLSRLRLVRKAAKQPQADGWSASPRWLLRN